MVRGRENPERWPLKDEEQNVALPQNVHNSVLQVDMPDFVPGQRYFMPERNSKRGDKAEVTTNQQEEAAPTTRDSADMEEERLIGLMSLAKLLSSSAPELGGEWQDWQEVKRREGQGTPRDHETSEHAVRESKRKMEKDGKTDTKEVEELDFMFDEELEQLDVGCCNSFTEWSDESDDDTEFEDKDVDKLLFITQTPPYLRKHPGGDRTGNYQTRAKYISGISKVISEGQQELWKDNLMQMEKDGKTDTKEVEELDFMFDEELEQLDVGCCNSFTEWSDESDDDTEFEDKDVDKLLFITQTPPYLRKHPGGDRTRDYQTRAKYISGISKVISEGQ